MSNVLLCDIFNNIYAQIVTFDIDSYSSILYAFYIIEKSLNAIIFVEYV